MGAEPLDSDFTRLKLAAGHILGNAASSAGDFVTGAVVEGDGEVERGVVLREFDRVVDHLEHVVLKAFTRADDVDLDTILVKVGQIAADEAAEQAEEIVDLL